MPNTGEPTFPAAFSLVKGASAPLFSAWANALVFMSAVALPVSPSAVALPYAVS